MKFGKHQPSSSICGHPIHADLQLARINNIGEYHGIAGRGNQTAGRIAVPSAWAPMSFAAIGDPPALSVLPHRAHGELLCAGAREREGGGGIRKNYVAL
jgi:hypothetical protein